MRWALVTAAALLVAGCSVPIARLGAVSASTVPPASLAFGLQPLGPAGGQACRWWVLGVPLGLPRVEEAVANALRPTGGVVLRDAILRSDHPIYGPIGRHCYTIRGTAWGPMPPQGPVWWTARPAADAVPARPRPR